ncbi:MAG: zinc ribbon domain-containing protein [Syntrophorhabdaceae bacterium]|nr:zinc ribbon domain-containing protein [Syntrophorhabdaceae bacterium]MDD4194937.1 zinc ribbon domain-containing protein [Syntrophorhabdaceae bacterium]
MPIYEYKCEDCGTVSEFIVFSADEEVACRSCSSKKLSKLMSAHNTTSSSGPAPMPGFGGGCCGDPGTCGSPGGCCAC